jgi:Fe-S-cluster-containing dehydrogenase component
MKKKVEKNDGKKKMTRFNPDLCLGCAVCVSACKFNSIRMMARQKRVFTPETIFDRLVSQAIERGKLADLIFDKPESLSHRALRTVTRVVERSPVFKSAMAVDSLKSSFLSLIVKGAKKNAGDSIVDMTCGSSAE